MATKKRQKMFNKMAELKNQQMMFTELTEMLRIILKSQASLLKYTELLDLRLERIIKLLEEKGK